jgi:hypothetical protein
MLPDTGFDDVKKQRNAEYAKHINDPVLSSLKMEGIRLLFLYHRKCCWETGNNWIPIYDREEFNSHLHNLVARMGK